MKEILDRHEKIALQFSGGRDSLACLFLLRPYLDRITVYWLNSGDAFPETKVLMSQVKAMVPHFVEVFGDVFGVRKSLGIPSDIIPASGTPLGRLGGETSPLIQSKYSCCFASIMRPMHEMMIDEGVTLIIRGQRNDDPLKAPIRSGTIDEGIEYLFPVEDWSEKDVMQYLEKEGAPIPRFYEVMNSTPDCMGCSAWWGESRALYLKRYHAQAYKEYQANLDSIRQAVGGHIVAFNTEVEL